MYNYRTGEETVVTFKNKTYSETPGFGLRNRFLLTVICYPINHWLEVSREVDISRARIYSLTTDRQPVTYCATNHLLERICFDSNTQETTERQVYPSDVASFPPLHEKKSRHEL